MKQRYASSFRSGQSLVEVLVAMSVLTIGFLGTIALLSRSFALNRLVSDRNVATYLAAESIEVAKNLIDANIVNGDAWDCGFGARDVVVNYLSFPPGAGICPGQAMAQWNQNNEDVRYVPSANAYMNNIPGEVPGNTDPTKFVRLLRITRPDPDLVVLNALVSWNDQAGPEQVNMENQFLNWRP
jgi:type II secretory pathway pseudopilin PulG